MNSTELKYIIDNGNSKSTDRLAILIHGLSNSFSEEKMKEITHLEITWSNLNGENIPGLNMTFEKDHIEVVAIKNPDPFSEMNQFPIKPSPISSQELFK